MFDASQYDLLDFGAGRKLERFGSEVLDRPSPAAEHIRQAADPSLWASATARFDLVAGGRGEWSGDSQFSSDGTWPVAHGESRLLLQFGASGNVGVFPEQAGNWDWIADQVKLSSADQPSRPVRVLNLFAYTGGASLAAAAAGAEVTHVDSSGPTVAAAKRNAEASGMVDLPIRWLVEDAIKFVARERRRGSRYDGIIADPPTYGHGPKGRPFKFRQHLGELMASCSELLTREESGNRFLLFSCHAPGFGLDDAESAVADVLPAAQRRAVIARPLGLVAGDGRTLAAGVSARWSAGSAG